MDEIICICYGLTGRELLEQVPFTTAGTCCSSCRSKVYSFLAEHRPDLMPCPMLPALSPAQESPSEDDEPPQ